MQTRRLSLFGRTWVVALHGDADEVSGWSRGREEESDAGGDLDVIDKGEDLDDNDSGVEDASDMDSDVEEGQIESLIKKYS